MTAVDTPHVQANLDRERVAALLKEHDIRFLRMSFTDIMGTNKNVEVPTSQFNKALDGEIMFDGSSIEGFVRIEESDMLLKPDFNTFRIYPWDMEGRGKAARLICDVYHTDGQPFEGCPRNTLKAVCERAAKMGYKLMAGPEAEFFLFERGENGELTTITNDSAGYFDMAPLDTALSWVSTCWT